MPFDSKSASEAGKRSKRGPVKKELPRIKEKMEILYKKTTHCSLFVYLILLFNLAYHKQ